MDETKAPPNPRLAAWVPWVLSLGYAIAELFGVWIEGGTDGTFNWLSYLNSAWYILGAAGWIFLSVWMVNRAWSWRLIVPALLAYMVLAFAGVYFIAFPLTQRIYQWLA